MDNRFVNGSEPIRRCATMAVHQRLLDRHPAYRRQREELENLLFTHKRAGYRLRDGTTLIPVVLHVLYNNLIENVSEEQIASQIDVLNRDYGATNTDRTTVPAVWNGILGNPRIAFRLADRDPAGALTSGITRTSTSVVAFGDDDGMKFSSRGGADAWPSTHYLNLWVCKLQNILGYAQFPEGPAETDGVVIDYRAFGTLGTADPPFDLGRTATHEVGHWLNLFHIWGDDGAGCTGTDQVDDTPNQAGPNTGFPIYPRISCDNGPDGDLFVNYMDYVDDRCMVMFSAGQVERMHATLDAARPTFANDAVLQPLPIPEPTPQPQPQPLPQAGQPPVCQWLYSDLTKAVGAPDAAGDPLMFSQPDGAICIVYRGIDKHIHALQIDSGHCP